MADGQSATPFAYEADRMYGAERAFAAGSRHEWLRGERPRILRLDDTRLLSIDFGAIPIPRRSIYDRLWKIPCYKGRRRRRVKTGDLVPRGYNPSIVRAPAGLCDGCAFVVAVRADTLHQCTGPGAISTGFAGTAIAVLDERLCLLAWTWLNVMPCQKDCIHPDGSRCAFAYALNTTPPPPWSLCTWRDVRLLNVAGRLLATYIGGSSRELFLFAHLHLEAQRHRTELKLRAWVARSHRPVHHAPWLLGRSQGLFVDRPLDEPGLLHLHVQPWLHLIGTLGTVAWRTRRRPSAFDAASKRMSERLVLSPASASAPLLVHNDTALLQHELWGGARGARERPLLSTTTHLIRIAAPRPGRRPCEALLGIGHLHRVPSNDSTAWGTAMVGCTPRPPATFRFGAQYTADPRYSHFFYTRQPRPPFRLLALSAEFCLSASGDREGDCESVQYVGGLSPGGAHPAARGAGKGWGEDAVEAAMRAERRSVVLSWGANDCESKLGRLPLERVWAMLRPLSWSAGEACVA